MKSKHIMNLIKFKERFSFKKNDTNNIRAIALFAMVLGLIAFLLQFTRAGEKSPQVSERFENIDVFIPEDQTLVPIKVANSEALDQIIGPYGVVDLYSVPLNDGERAVRIAYKVKLIRSSGQSEHFSVLMPADQAHRITGVQGGFYVSVRNPNSTRTQFIKKKPKAMGRTVIFESE